MDKPKQTDERKCPKCRCVVTQKDEYDGIMRYDDNLAYQQYQCPNCNQFFRDWYEIKYKTQETISYPGEGI